MFICSTFTGFCCLTVVVLYIDIDIDCNPMCMGWYVYMCTYLNANDTKSIQAGPMYDTSTIPLVANLINKYTSYSEYEYSL